MTGFRLKIEDLIKQKISAKNLHRIQILQSRLVREKEVNLLPKIVERSKNSIDVGANRGVYTYFLSRLSRQVFACEPNPNLAEFLRATVRGNVTVVEKAFSDNKRQGKLTIPIIAGHESHGFARIEGQSTVRSNESRVEPVDISTLDDEEYEDIGFLKIDVEGHELSVIRGAKTLIKKYRPNMLVEIEQRHCQFSIDDTFSYILSLGYQGFFVERRNFINLSNFTVSLHQDPYLSKDRSEILSRKYVNNFIFIKK